MRAILLSSILLLTACSPGQRIKVEVHLVKPPAQFLVTRIVPEWTPAARNKELGEYAKAMQDGWLSCEDDRAATRQYIEEYSRRVAEGAGSK